MSFYNIVSESNESTVMTEYKPTNNKSDKYQSEAELEKEFIKLLESQSYKYLPIHTENDLILNLRKKLGELNKYNFSDREWDQFHSPANLAKSIVIEAAELLECFQWADEEYDLQHVKEELADVMVYSQNLLDKLELDADEIVNMKMAMNEAKYPVEKAKGNATKYDRL